MKKIISLLISLVLIISIAPMSFAEETAVILGEGDSIELFAKDYKTSEVYTINNSKQFLGCDQPGYEGQVSVIHGNVFFKFNSEKEQVAKLKVKWAPNQQNDKRYMLAFLNPCATLNAGQYNDQMVVGVDYPDRDEAVINHQIAWEEYKDAKTTGEWNEEKITVTLKEGENLLWFPTLYLSEFSHDESDESLITGTKYTHPYLNSNESMANNQLLLYSLTIEIPEAEGSTVYTKDLAWTQVNAGIVGSVENKYNKSYMGDDPNGYTNMTFGETGECVIFPFNVTQNSEYIMKVYYAQPRQGNGYPSPASVYLDANSEYTDSANDKHMSELWNRQIQDEVVKAQTIAEFKTVNGKTISPIVNGTWSYTGSNEFINNGGQSETSGSSYYKAPYFRMKTFDLGTLEAGAHTVSFLTEKLNESDTATANKFVLFNRIEIIPAHDRASLDTDINTNVYMFSGDCYYNAVYSWLHRTLTTVSEAREIYANRGDKTYLGQYIVFDAEFINNSNTNTTYTPILAYYDAQGTLKNATVEANVSVEAVHNSTVNKKYQIDVSTLDADVTKIKLFIFDSMNTLVPAYSATILDDSIVQ